MQIATCRCRRAWSRHEAPACRSANGPAILRRILDVRYLAVEGPPGLGKAVLAERLSARLDAGLVLDEVENPFRAEAQAGRSGAAFQAQLFHLLARHRQQDACDRATCSVRSPSATTCSTRTRSIAYLQLDDNELFIYQRLYDLLAADLPAPDLVLYLQSPTDLLRRRLKERARRDADRAVVELTDISELNDAFNHFFFHYTAAPLLVVETSQLDLDWQDADVDDLLKQIEHKQPGTQYYVPRRR
jgi:deoxyguanosine kinase